MNAALRLREPAREVARAVSLSRQDGAPYARAPSARRLAMELGRVTMELDSKLLCLIRHGQGKHNPRADPRFLYHLAMVRDPELTALGGRQVGVRHWIGHRSLWATRSPQTTMPYPGESTAGAASR